MKNMILILTAFLLVLFSCEKKPTDVGGGVETGNTSAMVMGKLYLADGHTPAANATLHIRKKTVLADTSEAGLHKVLADTAATVTTDDTGGFAIDSINPGLYVIEGAEDSNVVLIDSVAVTSQDSTVVLPPDTLKPAGALKGVIYLSEGGDPRKVFILAFGIDRFAGVNTDGSFKFSNLAEGKYDLRIISSLDNYGVLDTFGISVISADTANLDTIRLPFIGIPTPKNVSIVYDTLRQIVTLTWAKADTALAKTYNVYRRNVGLNTVLARINTSPIADTVYRDSTGVQDSTYEYRVAAVNTAATEGTKSAVIGVKMVSAFAVLDTVGSGEGAGDTKFSGLIGIAIDSNNNIYAVNNGYNMVQKFDSSGNFLFHIGGVFGSDSGQFRYPTDVAVDSEGNVFIGDAENNRIQKFDRNGNYLLQWGRLGDSVGQFREIFAVTVYHGFVFVSEKTGSRVQKFDLSGNFLLSIDVGSNPKGIAVTDNAIFIIAGGTKVKQYNSNGTFVKDLYVPVKNSSITYVDGVQINDLAIFGNMILVLQPYDLKVVGVDVLGNVVSSFNVAQVLPESWGQRIEVENQTIYISTVRGFILKYVKK